MGVFPGVFSVVSYSLFYSIIRDITLICPGSLHCSLSQSHSEFSPDRLQCGEVDRIHRLNFGWKKEVKAFAGDRAERGLNVNAIPRLQPCSSFQQSNLVKVDSRPLDRKVLCSDRGQWQMYMEVSAPDENRRNTWAQWMVFYIPG